MNLGVATRGRLQDLIVRVASERLGIENRREFDLDSAIRCEDIVSTIESRDGPHSARIESKTIRNEARQLDSEVDLGIEMGVDIASAQKEIRVHDPRQKLLRQQERP